MTWVKALKISLTLVDYTTIGVLKKGILIKQWRENVHAVSPTNLFVLDIPKGTPIIKLNIN